MKVNSFMMPTVLRLAVGASLASCIAASSAAMNASGTCWLVSAWVRWSGKRCRSVAAGASGMRTGNRVASLASRAICGFQNQAVERPASPGRVGRELPGCAAVEVAGLGVARPPVGRGFDRDAAHAGGGGEAGAEPAGVHFFEQAVHQVEIHPADDLAMHLGQTV